MERGSRSEADLREYSCGKQQKIDRFCNLKVWIGSSLAAGSVEKHRQTASTTSCPTLPFSLSLEKTTPLMRIAPNHISILQSDEIFVFGSNLAGMHGGGAARMACKQFGAIWGQGVGLQGQSYAIPTMQGGIETIKPYVDQFIEFAKQNPRFKFLVTEIGCGIAGFTVEEIAPLFSEARTVENIYLPERFWMVLNR